MGRKGLLVPVMLALVTAGVGVAADTLLVANKSDHTLSFVSPDTGVIAGTVQTGQFPHEVSVSSDGRIAVVTNYGDRSKAGWTLTVVDVPARKVLTTINLVGHYKPHGLAWLPDGNVVVTIEAGQKILVVNPPNGEIVQQLPTEQPPPTDPTSTLMLEFVPVDIERLHRESGVVKMPTPAEIDAIIGEEDEEEARKMGLLVKIEPEFGFASTIHKRHAAGGSRP